MPGAPCRKIRGLPPSLPAFPSGPQRMGRRAPRGPQPMVRRVAPMSALNAILHQSPLAAVPSNENSPCRVGNKFLRNKRVRLFSKTVVCRRAPAE